MESVKALFIVLMVIAFALVITYISYGTIGYSPKEEIRPLGEHFVKFTFNEEEKTWWAASPETITAALWDYRGLDTVYETTVFYLAVIGCLAIFRLRKPSFLRELEEKGGVELTVIVKVVTSIIVAAILLISIDIALHGHITPGGGFQAGSAFAVAPLLLIAAFSRSFLEKLGFKINISHTLRTLGLLIIAFVAILPPLLSGFILQNQPKPWAAFPGYPVKLGPFELGGSLFYLDIGEYLNVAMGFLAIFLLISLPESVFKKDMEGVESGA